MPDFHLSCFEISDTLIGSHTGLILLCRLCARCLDRYHFHALTRVLRIQ